MSYFRDWIDKRKGPNGITKEFVEGVQTFLDFGFSVKGRCNKILCPCAKCKNWTALDQDTIATHLYANGFMPDYYVWIYHGETYSYSSSENSGAGCSSSTPDVEVENNFSRYRDMVTDNFPQYHGDSNTASSESDREAKDFYELLSYYDKFLYSDHNQSMSQWVTKVMDHKTTHNLSQSAMNDHIDGLRRMVHPMYQDEIPKNYTEVKRIISKLGLGVIKYDVCINDCFLYYREGEQYGHCPRCNAPRFTPGTTTPQKKLRYFPITPRLQRLYMSKKTAEHMTWHTKCREESERIIHPAGAEAWKHFDRTHPTFAADPRNVRLGLCSDGFNPFRGQGTQYSCWPVFITPYNLPPTLAMQQEFIFLSLIIAGPKGPRVNIDVMLRPLIDELKSLWMHGAITWDCVRRENFTMRAALMWTINDFPAYGMLSGWSTHGKLACPYCMEQTDSFRLKNGGKPTWFGCHRCFLPRNHPYRKNTRNFYKDHVKTKVKEERPTPDYMKRTAEITPDVTFGKMYECIEDFGVSHNWTKRSIFYELEYWPTLLIHHNVDVMHTENNIFDNIFDTIMNVPKRTKDNRKARLDLPEYTTREAKPTYVLDPEQKLAVCEWLKQLRFPDGHVSNISNSVNLETKRLNGLKSHDCHVFMQRLIPIAFKDFLPEPIWEALTEVSNCFKSLCSSEIKASEL